ncbi:phage tail protein [Ralstonia holmesii]
MSVAAASASATMTADEIVVESALGGLRYCLASFNKTINLGTVGAGGMDVGTAPVSGYVALYAIYNPTTSTAALLATNATSAVAPHVYGGANMPSGYTASALVSVWPTNGSSQFVQAVQRDRRISLVSAGGFTTATTAASWTSIAIGGIPQNAVRVSGNISSLTSVASVTQLFQVASDANGAGAKSNVSTTVVASNGTSMPFDLDIYTAQTAWYKASNPSGTPSFSMIVAAYDI